MYRLRSASIALVAIAVITVAIGVGAGTVAAQSDDRVVLEVELTKSDDGSLGNATVTAQWDNNEASTTSLVDGVARMEVPRDEDLTIQISHEEYIRNHPIEVEDYEGDRVETTLYPKAEATIEVVDSEGALQNATVRMWKRSADRLAANGMTGTDGTFETPVIEAGDYSVEVTRPGYTSVRTELQVDNETTETILLTSDSADVDVRTRDAVLNESIGANIRVISDDETVLTTRTSADRGARTLSLPVNTDYTISFSKDGYESVNRSLDLEEDDRELTTNMTRLQDLVVTPDNDNIVINETLRVTVTDEYERPVEDATVSLGEETVETDENGEATLNATTAGQFNLTAEKNDRTAGPVRVTVIDPDDSGIGGQFGLIVLGGAIALVGIVAILVLIRGREP